MSVTSVVRSSQIEALFGCIRNDMKIRNLMLAKFAAKHFRIALIWLFIKGFIQVLFIRIFELISFSSKLVERLCMVYVQLYSDQTAHLPF